jgi:hypothetical protein
MCKDWHLSYVQVLSNLQWSCCNPYSDADIVALGLSIMELGRARESKQRQVVHL